MKPLFAVTLAATLAFAPHAHAQNAGHVTHFINGQWFDGSGFVKTDFYAEGQTLTHHPTERRSYTTVDLHGGYVIPPFGDAHEHNFDALYNSKAVADQYIKDGIFYAQGMTDTTEGAAEVVAAQLVDTPTTPDVTYAHGGLTGTNGHPKDVYEALANGIYYAQNDAQRKLVIDGQKSEGHAIWQLATPADLDAKWPRILATKPDLIKIYLARTESFKQATAEDPQLGRGLNPVLVPLIVAKAHAAHLRVAAHVESPADVHVALVSGVDQLGHTLDYGMTAADDPAGFRIADSDVALAARRHVIVQATAGLATSDKTPADDLAARQKSQRDNLGRLKRAGVTIVAGSDQYGRDSLHEADYLQALGLWTNLEMLRLWAVQTPQAIFPKRKIGQLKPGYEASFLVLSRNPLEDWTATHQITTRYKQGHPLETKD